MNPALVLVDPVFPVYAPEPAVRSMRHTFVEYWVQPEVELQILTLLIRGRAPEPYAPKVRTGSVAAAVGMELMVPKNSSPARNRTVSPRTIVPLASAWLTLVSDFQAVACV
jgi:hypothetical protein